MPQKIHDFCTKTNQPAPESPGEFIRTCLESLALTYRKTIDGLEDILGRRLSTIHIVGGGTQNELLNQMTADATNRQVITGPIEATAIGNILVCAIAKGDLKNLAEARQVVKNSFPVQPYTPQNTNAWNDAYARYRQILSN
jgi:sugar (pentulose or hexulose) kinase